MEPDDFLALGAQVLQPRLEPLGYRFEIIRRPVSGSGGRFSIGAFKLEDREIHLWARHQALGGVSYHYGNEQFSHIDHMRALGFEKMALYPGFPDDDVVSGFRRFDHDLRFCQEFLVGNAARIVESVKLLAPPKTGFKALST
jgi:hypothetical protein